MANRYRQSGEENPRLDNSLGTKLNNRLLAILGFGLAFWVLAYCGFWLWHSGCFLSFTKQCLDAPIEPVRAFVMFDWLYGYQSLVAGALAVVAAGAIFLNSDRERAARQVERQDQQAQEFAACVSRLRAQFRRATVTIGTSEGDVQLTVQTLVELDAAILSIVDRCPRLGERLQLLIGFATLRLPRLRQAKSMAEKRQVVRTIAAFTEVGVVALTPERALKDESSFPISVEGNERKKFSWDKLQSADKKTLSSWVIFH